MKLITLTTLAIATLMACSFGGDIKTLKIGDNAPKVSLEMKGVDDKDYSLESSVKENGLLVIFSCNTCPFVIGNDDSDGWEGRYNGIYETAAKNNVGVLIVNSNEAKRDGADSMKKMKTHAKEANYMAPYVLDKNHELADAFGARTTPHIFLFDSEMELAYTGAIDDNGSKANEVKEHWLSDGLTSLAKGERLDPATTKNTGCSIKRVK